MDQNYQASMQVICDNGSLPCCEDGTQAESGSVADRVGGSAGVVRAWPVTKMLASEATTMRLNH